MECNKVKQTQQNKSSQSKFTVKSINNNT